MRMCKWDENFNRQLTKISLAFIYKAVYTAGRKLLERVSAAVVAAYVAIIVLAMFASDSW